MMINEMTVLEVIKDAANLDHLSSYDLFCVINSNGYLTWCNEKFLSIAGNNESELFRRPLLEFTHPDEREDIKNVVCKLVTADKYVSFVNRHQSQDGTYQWLEWIGVADLKNGMTYAVARRV